MDDIEEGDRAVAPVRKGVGNSAWHESVGAACCCEALLSDTHRQLAIQDVELLVHRAMPVEWRPREPGGDGRLDDGVAAARIPAHDLEGGREAGDGDGDALTGQE